MPPLLKTLLAFSTLAEAHMQLHSPAPFNASNNLHTNGHPDTQLHYPYNCCGRRTEYPCRGYLSLLGTPAGAPTVTWAPGSLQNWSMAGPAPLGGTHYGGSCQIGLSIDKGNTFRTVVSYEGNCPHRDGSEDPTGQTFNFTVPRDLPTGEAVFAWTWVNREQEFNMNCAAVFVEVGNTTSEAGGVPPISIPSQAYSVAFNDRPEMFIADTRHGCLTPKTDAELKFPEPGINVEEGDGMYPKEEGGDYQEVRPGDKIAAEALGEDEKGGG
ncbi:hypothetical protein Vi05172_g7020 [Venturia inaequalis]|nr:hypothetical protein Vi05172_g7020 [Venturia inaequalis]